MLNECVKLNRTVNNDHSENDMKRKKRYKDSAQINIRMYTTHTHTESRKYIYNRLITHIHTQLKRAQHSIEPKKCHFFLYLHLLTLYQNRLYSQFTFLTRIWLCSFTLTIWFFLSRYFGIWLDSILLYIYFFESSQLMQFFPWLYCLATTTQTDGIVYHPNPYVRMLTIQTKLYTPYPHTHTCVDRFTDSEYVTHIITIRCTNIIALRQQISTNGNRLSKMQNDRLNLVVGVVGVEIFQT